MPTPVPPDVADFLDDVSRSEFSDSIYALRLSRTATEVA
jgi:hypothetical protein